MMHACITGTCGQIVFSGSDMVIFAGGHGC